MKISRFNGSAAAVASALEGQRAGNGWLCRCPVATHGRRRGDVHPSLSLRDGDNRLLVKCHAGCDTRDVLAALRSKGHVSAEIHPGPAQRPAPARDGVSKMALARAIWDDGKPILGTPAETYLLRRGITAPIPPAIRSGKARIKGEYLPTMIAAVHNEDGTIVAVQRTYLTTDGRKAALPIPRLNLGRFGAGAVKLGEPTAVLGIAEGTEDALAATQLTGIPCWAALSEVRLSKIAIPAHVGELHIFADADDAGRNGARAAAEHYAAQGIKVAVRFPPNGFKDFAEVVEAAVRRAA
jgi:putative DNA primase/helicase